MKPRKYKCQGCGRSFEVPPMVRLKAGDRVCASCAFEAELVRTSLLEGVRKAEAEIGKTPAERRARDAWRDWTDADIKTELAPWFGKVDAE